MFPRIQKSCIQSEFSSRLLFIYLGICILFCGNSEFVFLLFRKLERKEKRIGKYFFVHLNIFLKKKCIYLGLGKCLLLFLKERKKIKFFFLYWKLVFKTLQFVSVAFWVHNRFLVSKVNGRLFPKRISIKLERVLQDLRGTIYKVLEYFAEFFEEEHCKCISSKRMKNIYRR